ncbi:CYFA0S07e03246g1_1 [Cyberlindnera fabianii]|uniref:CYFA0S07e03246g1_1 n=1 Tax=Cyberlindnera fabianii TaxID=36022 RepID=A0A061B3H6_CYBFA|nr:CYFA0S07e03246g1_1 [Cyberlindnera fabianii]
MSSRRSEIEAKRARLAELRRQREEKERQFRSSTPSVSPEAPQKPAIPVHDGGDRKSIDHIVSELVGDKKLKDTRKEQRSISIQTEDIAGDDLPTRITYNKSTQTEIEESDEENDDSVEQMKKDDQEATTPETTPAPEITHDDTPSTLTNVDDSVLSSFFTRSFKVINRAFEENSKHDILLEYTQRKHQALEKSRPYVLVDTLSFDSAVRCIDTSPFFPDLIIISTGPSMKVYNSTFRTFEYNFNSQTQIIQVQFSQSQSNFIFGTGYNGKLHIWDLESTSHLPYLSSMVSSSTHSYPIFSIDQVQENNGVIITGSTDGRILHWDPEILARPSQPAIQLRVPKSLALRYDELTPWCIAHLKDDHGFLLVGCEDGNIYKVKRFDNKINEDAIDDIITAHDAPVTAIDPSFEFANLFISSGMDWKVYLWDINAVDEPLMEVYKSNTIVGCAWRPEHATQIGYAYEDVFEILDLSIDAVTPVLKIETAKTITGFKFTKNGERVVISTFDGDVVIYELMLQDIKSDMSRFKGLYITQK